MAQNNDLLHLFSIHFQSSVAAIKLKMLILLVKDLLFFRNIVCKQGWVLNSSLFLIFLTNRFDSSCWNHVKIVISIFTISHFSQITSFSLSMTYFHTIRKETSRNSKSKQSPKKCSGDDKPLMIFTFTNKTLNIKEIYELSLKRYAFDF